LILFFDQFESDSIGSRRFGAAAMNGSSLQLLYGMPVADLTKYSSLQTLTEPTSHQISGVTAVAVFSTCCKLV